MNILISLNGDGMVNIHPKKDTVNSSYGEYTFKMNGEELKEYLEKNQCFLLGDKIVDNEDGYFYGQVIDFDWE